MPPAPPARLVPRGFMLAGSGSLCLSFAMLALLLIMEVEGETGPLAVGVRGAAVLLGSLGLITTEALWKARPSAYPASLALAVSWFVSLPAVAAMAGVADGGTLDYLWRAAFILGVSSVGVIPMLLYIRHRTRRLWPRAAAGVPAVRP